MLADLTVFHPDSLALVRAISPHIDDGMLEEIAAADYGMEVDEHLAELRKIRDGSYIYSEMEHVPHEVLMLIKWSEPEDLTHRPGGYGKRGHWMRAFCCAALLAASEYPANDWPRQGLNNPVIQLIQSLGALGGTLQSPATSAIAHLLRVLDREDRYDNAEELPFFALALLWLGLHPSTNVPDKALCTVIDYAEAIESRCDEVNDEYAGTWLLGKTFFDQCHSKWIQLGKQLSELNLANRSLPLQKRVHEIANRLAQT